ncbi:hypothetical protein E2L08_05470 [Palleronia sediminis]|uniref:Sulfotransferase family protein n=1 Tax=Palleronia sediminis TaxID=2547833 RepID=A0A4R6AGJ0_9RHOB|nr:sulfotransferase [Palleronia sediminis]TDL81568.1 hypothetical protein E2L08_05470 [Palleronia sediminis]
MTDRVIHIVASPYKTATSSVGDALIRLGVGTRDMGYKPRVQRAIKPLLKPLNAEADAATDLRAWMSGNAARVRETLVPVIEAMAPYDVFSDAPCGHAHIHPAIHKILHPAARLIWVDRDEESWVASVRNWEITHPDVYKQHHLWDENPDLRRKRILARRAQRRGRFARTAELFPDDMLTVPMADLDSYAPLCRFYGVAIPDEGFPRANVSRKA